VLHEKVTDVATIIDREASHTDILQALFALRQILRRKVFIKIAATTSTTTRHSNGYTAIRWTVVKFMMSRIATKQANTTQTVMVFTRRLKLLLSMIITELANTVGLLGSTSNDRVRIGALTVRTTYLSLKGARRGQEHLSNRRIHTLLERKS
jgi:hypothetical protein